MPHKYMYIYMYLNLFKKNRLVKGKKKIEIAFLHISISFFSYAIRGVYFENQQI